MAGHRYARPALPFLHLGMTVRNVLIHSEKTMDRSEVQRRVVKVVCQVLGVEPEMVKPESHFVFDLGAESTQSVELVAAFEHEFGIEMGRRRRLGGADESAMPWTLSANAYGRRQNRLAGELARCVGASVGWAEGSESHQSGCWTSGTRKSLLSENSLMEIIVRESVEEMSKSAARVVARTLNAQAERRARAGHRVDALGPVQGVDPHAQG